MNVIAWLDGIQHKAKHGHWPNYYDVGKGLAVDGLFLARVCVDCLKGGHRRPVFRLVPQRMPW